MAHIDDSIPGTGTGSPYLNSLLWGCGWSADPGDPAGPVQISVRFGMPGEDPFGIVTGLAQAWDDRQMNGFRTAFQLYENVARVDFVEVASFNDADMVESGHVTTVDHTGGVDVHVDADSKAANGFELVIATLNTLNTIAVGDDILVTS